MKVGWAAQQAGKWERWWARGARPNRKLSRQQLSAASSYIGDCCPLSGTHLPKFEKEDTSSVRLQAPTAITLAFLQPEWKRGRGAMQQKGCGEFETAQRACSCTQRRHGDQEGL